MLVWSRKRGIIMGDDPPYLAVGTEVSAKYKGAFCEAKVRKVVRSVKCKVTFKLGLGSAVITDDQIRGTLRVGSTCEARHPDKKEFSEATITKIQDCSQYTVVFDDGDITTLRRTALCLKSGRHFAESETLDQLPLTHPEHFSSPVVVERTGRRSRQTHNDSVEDEVTPKKGKQKEEKEADIGKVVCVELGDKKKQKDNWFPGLVVAPTAQDTVRIRVKEEYLVRSFKDGRYFTVPKKEATEFTKEIGGKVDNNTLKTAVEKALLFLDKDELPPHWDRDLLFGLDDSSGNSDSDAGFDSDSSDDEPREEKDHFVAQLYKFMDDRGTPINKGPTIGSRDVDLYKLFKVVHKLGGYNRVTNHNQWKTVSHKLGFGMSGSSVINLVKQSYKKFLHSFEDFYRKLGCTMVNHPRGNRSRHRAGRSLIRDRDRSTPINIPKDKDKSANTIAEKRTTEFGDRDTQLAESIEFLEDTKKGTLEESTKLPKDLTKEEHTKKMENIEVVVDKMKEKEEKVKPKEEKLKLKEQKVKPKEEKVKPKEEKVKPKEEKVKPKEEKVKPKEEKVKPKEEKVKPKEEKVKPKEEKVKPKEEKVKPKEEKVKPKEEKVNPKEEKMKPKEEKMKPKEEKMKPKEEKMKPKEEKVKPKEEKVKPQEEKLKAKEEKVKPKEEKLKPKEEKVNPKEEKVKPKEEKVNPKENKVNPKEDKVKIKDDKVNPKDDKVKLKDDKSKVLEVPKKDIEDKEERLRARETKKDDKSKEKELRGRMTELEKVVRIVLEDGGRLVQMSAAGCSTHVPATIPNKEIKARKEEKTKFITKEKLEEKQKIKEGDKLTTDEGENSDEIKRKVEKKSDDDEKQTRSKSKDEPRSKKDVAPVDRRTRESRSPGREFEKKPSPPSLQKTKKLDDDIIVLGCQKKRGRKRKDSEEKPRSEESTGQLSNHVTVLAGDKLKVYYGPTQESKVVYEAKVVEIDMKQKMFLVHYTGWNTRYDEWIKRGRIAENLSWTPSRDRRARQSGSQNKLRKPLQGKRGRPSLSSHSQDGSSRSCSKEPRSTTPSSVTSCSSRAKSPATPIARPPSSRITRNTSVESLGLGLEFLRRTRRMSGHTDMSVASYTESEDEEEEEEEEEFETDAETEEADTAVSAQTRSKSEKKDNSSPESSGVTDEKPFRRKLLEEDDDASLGERRSKRTKKIVAPIVPTSSSSSLSSSPSIKGEEEAVKTEMIEEEELLSEDEQPRGRDFDLNQIRSELKGIERAVNISPEDTLLKHSEDKQEPLMKLITEFKEETVMLTKEEYSIPVDTEQTKKPEAFKNISDTSAEDIYEFKEPEPFEFEVRAKRDLSEGRRPISRIFDEVVPETKVDKSPRKRFGRGKVAIKINSPLEGEMKRRFNRTIGRKIEQATQSGKNVQEVADKPAVTEPTPVTSKPRQLSACEEAFDKLCESPFYHSASKPSPSGCLASDSSAVDISPLSLFSELPGEDQEDDCGEDSNDRLVISETEETVAESEGPLFSYPKLFPGLVGSDPPVPKMEETSLGGVEPIDKPPEPPRLPPTAESSLFDTIYKNESTTKLEFETDRQKDICKANVSEECKKEEDDMGGCNLIETSTTMHEDVIKLLLKPGKVVEDYEEDPINAAIQRVIEQSMSDGSNDADIFNENTVLRQPSPVSSSLRQDQTFSPNKEEHSEIDFSVECIKSSPNTEPTGDITVQESAILNPKSETCVGVLSPRRDIFNRESSSMSPKNELNINMKSPMRETSASSPKREMTSKDQTENKISSSVHPQSEQSSKKLSPRRPASDESSTDSSDEESRLVIATKPDDDEDDDDDDDDDNDDDEEEEKRTINKCQVEEASNSNSSSECLSLRLRLTSECEDIETTEAPSLVKSPQWETYSDNSVVAGTIEKGTLFCFEKIVKQEGNEKTSDSYNIESGDDKSDDDDDDDGSADITLQNPKRRRLDFEPESTEKIMENNPGNIDLKTNQNKEEPVCEAVKSPSLEPYADLSLKCEELDIPASPLPEGKADPDTEAADNLCSLLCEETIPGSPAPVTEAGQEQETENKVLEMPFASAVSSNCVPPPATSSNVPVSVGVAVKRGSSEAAPVMDNTPPTTPDSTLSTISDSPREEQERLSPNLDNESSKSHRDSFELDIDSCENKVEHYSEDDSLLNVEISNSSDARLGKKIEKDGYKKRRHSRKRSESEVIKRIRPNLVSRSPRSDIGGDSDDSSENSVDCTPTNSDSVMASSRSPRPSKYNFYVELDPDMDGSQRIALLQHKLQELRKTYINVKAELACIDRRRKKLRRREREEKATKQEIICS